MSGIDDRLERIVRQPVPHPLDATEASDAHRTGGHDRFTHTSGERGDDVESSLAGDDFGQLPGFPGAAENQNPQCRSTSGVSCR
jgi:hypothetical protein